MKASKAFLCLHVSVLTIAFYLQYAKGIHPCPLCIMQRLCAGLLALTSLIALGKKSCNIKAWSLFFSSLGLYFSLRQLWLQALPSEANLGCLPDWQVLWQWFPWKDLLTSFFWGSVHCGEVTFTFLSLSLAAWSFLYFAFCFFFALLFLERNP